jgi:hypothetical protein
MQSIIQTHKTTWTDCQQLLLTLFNTKEQHHIMLAALKWLEDQAPEGTLKTQAYAHAYSLNKTPIGTPIIVKITNNLNGITGIIGRHEGRRGKGHECEQNIRSPPRAR